MNRPAQRILNALAILKGPFQKQGKLEFRLNIRSELEEKPSSQVLALACLQAGFETSVSGAPLKLQLSHSDGQLHLLVPKGSRLRKATFMGWHTIWDGTTALLQEDSAALSLAIPAVGWWNLTFQSTSVDWVQCNSKEQSDPVPFSVALLTALRAAPRRFALYFKQSLSHGIFSTAFHALLFAGLLNITGVKTKILSLLPPELTAPMQEAAKLPLQVPLQMEASEGEFSGRGLFATQQQQQQKQQDSPSKVSHHLKALSGLIRTSQVALNVREKQPTGGSNAGSVASTMRSLLGGIAKQTGGVPGGTARNGEAVQVQWNAQFPADTRSAAKPSQQDYSMLHQVFSKYQDKFRGCYETALLKFDEMSVTVTFEADILRGGRIDHVAFTTNGNSTKESKELLLGCIKNVMSQIKVPETFVGIRIKNQFLFKS